MENIVTSGWYSIRDHSLQLAVPDNPAQVNDSIFNSTHSELDLVRLVFGSWLEQYIIRPVNEKLHNSRRIVVESSKKHYNPVKLEELLHFFLAHFLRGLERHKKHDIDATRLSHLQHSLMGVNRYEALAGCLDVGDNIMASICESLATHFKKFVIPGTSSCVDETIFPHYGEKAFNDGNLVHIPGKPFDYGMVTYTLAQKFTFTHLPVCLGLCPNFCGVRVTPTAAAISLLGHLPPQGVVSFNDKHLHADSLWSMPVTIAALTLCKIPFTIAIQPKKFSSSS